MKEVNGKSLRFRQQLLQLVIIERRFILALYKATEKEKGEGRRGGEGKRSRERLRNRHRAASSFFRYIKIYFYTTPAPIFLTLRGVFIGGYRADYRSSHFRSSCSFLRSPATPIWRSNVAVFAVIRIILATCKSERKTLLCSPFWMDSYINTVPFSCRRQRFKWLSIRADVKHLLRGRLSDTIELAPERAHHPPANCGCMSERWKLP